LKTSRYRSRSSGARIPSSAATAAITSSGSALRAAATFLLFVIITSLPAPSWYPLHEHRLAGRSA